MRILLVLSLIFLFACSSHQRKINRLKAENPECEVTDEGEILCGTPFDPVEYETLTEEDVAQISGLGEDKKITVNCNVRARASARSKVVGYLAKGSVVRVAKDAEGWYNHYDHMGGVIVYISSKCFDVRKVKRGKK